MNATAATSAPRSRRRPARTLLRFAGSALMWLGLAAAVAMVASSLLGLQRYVITGQSMTGTIDKGSIVWDKVVPTTSLRVGDIITYDPASPKAPEGNITHRIIWTGTDAKGKPGFQTKGDYNDYKDPWRFGLGDKAAKEVFHVPYLGYVLAYASQPKFRMIIIGVPALLVALAVLVGLWKDAGDELAAEKERQQQETSAA
jgi:signal peptidase I